MHVRYWDCKLSPRAFEDAQKVLVDEIDNLSPVEVENIIDANIYTRFNVTARLFINQDITLTEAAIISTKGETYSSYGMYYARKKP